MKKLLLLLIMCTCIFAYAQKKDALQLRVANTKAVYLGKVNPIQGVKKTAFSLRTKMKMDKQLPPNFIGRGKSKAVIKELEHQGQDPLRQVRMPNRSATLIEPLVNVDGLFNSFGSPHDPTGSIGTNHYVQAINATEIGIFDKSGNKISEFAANALWEPLGESSLGDPIVMFDHQLNQWIITEFAEPALLLIAVSVDDDPEGEYNVYSFATPNFPDYPKYAIWEDHIVVTTNELGPGSLHQYFIDREALMSGSNDVTIQRVEIQGNSNTEAGFYVTTPVHWNGAIAPADNKPIAVKINDSSWGEVSADALEVFTFDIDFDDAANTTVEKLTLETTPFDSYPCDNESGGFACLSQGGNGSGGLDAIPEVVMNIPHYRNFETHESIVLNFITDVTDGDNLSGIRWMELRRTPGNDWSIYQEGTFAPDDGLHRYMGSIGIDASGNIGMAYNVSSPTDFAGIRFTGRFAEDALGQMTVEEYEVIAGTNFINTDRFGDYPHITIDPVDGQTFWYTAEYGGNGSNNSKTRLLAFQLEKKDNDIAVTTISSPETSADLTSTEQVKATIINNGNLSATGFDVTLSLDGNEVETFSFTESFATESSYEHTFSNTVDLSAIGEYEIAVSISYAPDESTGNDSRTKTVKKLAQLDGEISLHVVEETCNSSVIGEITLSNKGATEITNAQFELFVDENSLGTQSFTGTLGTGDIASIEVEFSNMVNGVNNLSAVLLSVNGTDDNIAENNNAETNVEVGENLEQIVFTIDIDEFPNETTWEIADAEGIVLLSGGPYSDQESIITEYLCLPTDQCYVFTIYDSVGDGICCDFGEGSFSLADGDGNLLFESDGDFGDSQDALICFGDGTYPAVDVSVSILSDEGSACLANFPAAFEIKNEAAEALTSVSIEVSLNGTLLQTIEWTGNLSFGETAIEEVSLGELPDGGNTLRIEAKNPNETTDEDISNNVDELTLDNADNLMSVEVSIRTDDFPEETIWGILDENDDVVVAFGPFEEANTTLTEQICLIDESCYTFVIVDTFGDGIDGGSFSVTDGFGEQVAGGALNFVEQFEDEFCLDAADACKLSVSVESVEVTRETTGSIIITATGAINLQYSIDGGITFQASNVFDGLVEGSYEVIVHATDECFYEETIVIGRTLGVENKRVIISPNPTNGIFQVHFATDNFKTEFLDVEIMDLNGKVIQSWKFSRYNEEFIGTVSLVAYPKGVYIIKMHTSSESFVTKVIKQ